MNLYKIKIPYQHDSMIWMIVSAEKQENVMQIALDFLRFAPEAKEFLKAPIKLLRVTTLDREGVWKFKFSYNYDDRNCTILKNKSF